VFLAEVMRIESVRGKGDKMTDLSEPQMGEMVAGQKEKIYSGLPVEGYRPVAKSKVDLVNENKILEERVIRRAEWLKNHSLEIDGRFVSIAITHFQEGFMALNRAIFMPQRVKLPEDDNNKA
jgi:hypothetical protein